MKNRLLPANTAQTDCVNFLLLPLSRLGTYADTFAGAIAAGEVFGKILRSPVEEKGKQDFPNPSAAGNVAKT